MSDMTETMSNTPSTAAAVIEVFSRRLEAGDLEGALALYEDGATFAPQPGQQIRGVDAIRQALEQFIALRPTMTGTIEKVLEAEGVALVANRWTLRGTSPDGAPVELAGVSSDVMRRQADGSWRLLIDDPWGSMA
jgi:uncharacterized protein (TIGR02246 family)